MSFFKRIWNWIKSLFGWEPEVPVIEAPQETEQELVDETTEALPELTEQEKETIEESGAGRQKLKATKIAIIVGHSPKRPGAKNYLKETEYSFNCRIAEKMKEYLAQAYPEKKVKIFYRPEGYYLPSIKQVAEDVGKWKAKVSLELHFNSFKTKAYGCETLIWADSENVEETAKYADALTDELAKKFNLSERSQYEFKNGMIGDGVKALSGKDRGRKNLQYVEEQGVKVAMLVEPCYANIEQRESKAIFENEDDYALVLADELAKINL
jgi:N-acetylmuramoyl-L-alanine amidase